MRAPALGVRPETLTVPLRETESSNFTVPPAVAKVIVEPLATPPLRTSRKPPLIVASCSEPPDQTKAWPVPVTVRSSAMPPAMT